MKVALGVLLAVSLLGAAALSQEGPGSGSSVNRLAVELLKRSMQAPENSVCSPYSVGSALALTCAAAAGPTQDQLAQAITLPPAQVLPQYGELRTSLEALPGPGVEWAGANRVWAGRPFEQPFVAAVKRSLGAEPAQVDFTRADTARRTINEWVSGQTQKQIPELLQGGDISRETEIVLTNALFFKGAWSTPFDPGRTRPAPFRRENGQGPVQVPMMHREGYLLSNVNPGNVGAPDFGMDVVEIPYRGGRAVLDVILPRPGTTLAQLVPTLTADKLEGAVGALEEGNVKLSLPRFSLKYRVDLRPVVEQLAGPLPFSSRCDLSAALGPAGRGVPLAKVIHAARLDTDEVGSTAAAATAVTGLRSGPEPFLADRHFLVLLRDRQTGTILFLGRVEDPSQ